MRKIYLIYMMAIASLMGACTGNLDESPAEGREIKVRAGVTDLQVSARAAVTAKPFLGDFPTTGHELETAIWFSLVSGKYENKPEDREEHIPIRTKVHFNDEGWKYPVQYEGDNLRYPSSKEPVYCVGLYPTDTEGDENRKWNLNGDCTSTWRTINGVDDLMFARQIEGRWGTPFPNMQFQHMQTWVKVCICATSHAAIDVWGKIKKITVGSHTRLNIDDLADGTPTYTEEGSLIAMENETTPLTITINEVGNLFCSPPYKKMPINVARVDTDVCYYELKVLTEKLGEQTVQVPIRNVHADPDTFNYTESWVTAPEQAIGRLYTLCLYFHEYGVVDGICILKSWENQDENLYPNS